MRGTENARLMKRKKGIRESRTSVSMMITDLARGKQTGTLVNEESA